MQIDLTGRTALITGGSKGLGLAMATEFSASGADVAIFARDQGALEAARDAIAATAKGRVMAVSADVRDAEKIKRAYQLVMDDFGQVDILVNNAGTSRTSPFMELSDEDWQADLDLKLFAAIRLIRLVWPQMTERRWGRVINVLNIRAKSPAGGTAPTSVSRAAGMALTKVLAGEGAAHNVLVNALLVGNIASDQWVQRHAKIGSNVTLEDYYATMGSKIPLGRIGRAEEFANMATFLASDAASYITGTAINVDGGASPVV
jgi:NAD(P)-dependent dehydrogenase (short-subunit alcohol dehydrogenase family)